MAYVNGMPFSTPDADHDGIINGNCAAAYAKSGWWYKVCHKGVLTGYYYNKNQVDLGIRYGVGITFEKFHIKQFYYSVKYAEGKLLISKI